MAVVFRNQLHGDCLSCMESCGGSSCSHCWSHYLHLFPADERGMWWSQCIWDVFLMSDYRLAGCLPEEEDSLCMSDLRSAWCWNLCMWSMPAVGRRVHLPSPQQPAGGRAELVGGEPALACARRGHARPCLCRCVLGMPEQYIAAGSGPQPCPGVAAMSWCSTSGCWNATTTTVAVF